MLQDAVRGIQSLHVLHGCNEAQQRCAEACISSRHELSGWCCAQLKERCAEVAPGKVPSVEGLGSSADDNADWLVVDAGSVVAHIFEENARELYDIEGLWGGEPEAALAQG